jgi:hypothetical protein
MLIGLIDDTLDPGARPERTPRGNSIKALLERERFDVVSVKRLTKRGEKIFEERVASLPAPIDLGATEIPGYQAIPQCDLYLVHITQDLAPLFVEQVNARVPKTPMVGYSGGGLFLTKGKIFESAELTLIDKITIHLSEPSYYAVYQPTVHRGNETDFTIVVRSLCDLTRSRSAGALTEDAFLSEFHRLFTRPGANYLSAMMVLCQGYLAMHADTRDTHPEVDDALIAMGLTSEFVGSDAGGRVRDLTNDKRKREVSRSSWWQRVLGDRLEDLNAKLSEEYGGELPDAVRALTQSIYGKPGELANPVIAAVAYSAILKKFRSRSK